MRSDKDSTVRPLRHTVRGNCQVVRERDFRLVADRIENVSAWGLLVGPADPVLTGERVFVSFQLPGSDRWYDACGVVTRIIHGRRPGETSRSFALEFTDLGAFDRFKLRRALERVPVTPPAARPGRRGWFDLSLLAS